MKKTKNYLRTSILLSVVFVLQGCYTQMETTKKVRVSRRPVVKEKTYTYTYSTQNDSLVYYEDDDGDLFYLDEYGNVVYFKEDSLISTAYQTGFALETPQTQIVEHYYYYDPFYYDSYYPYYNDYNWRINISYHNGFYHPNYWDRYYRTYYWNYSYFDPYWGYSPWYATYGGYYWTHHYGNHWNSHWYFDKGGYYYNDLLMT